MLSYLAARKAVGLDDRPSTAVLDLTELLKGSRTRAVTGSDYSPAAALSEEKYTQQNNLRAT